MNVDADADVDVDVDVDVDDDDDALPPDVDGCASVGSVSSPESDIVML